MKKASGKLSILSDSEAQLALNTPATMITFDIPQAPGLLGEIADSRIMAGRIYDEHGAFFMTKKQENDKKKNGLSMRNTGDNLAEQPMLK